MRSIDWSTRKLPGADVKYRNTLFAAVIMAGLTLSSCAVPQESEEEPVTWRWYEVDAASLEFEHRSDWAVEEIDPIANDPAGGVSLEVRDGGGRLIAGLDTGVITDLVCTPTGQPPAYVEYDAQPMPELESAGGTEQRFVYRSVSPAPGAGAQVTYAVVSGPVPTPEAVACGLFDYFDLTESSGGRFSGAVHADEGSSVEQHLQKAAAFENSQEFRDVKRMLVSLRNTD